MNCALARLQASNENLVSASPRTISPKLELQCYFKDNFKIIANDNLKN